MSRIFGATPIFDPEGAPPWPLTDWPWDEDVQGWLVGPFGEDAVWIIPMIFNNRIVIGRQDAPGYDHGWCYDKGAAAFLAAAAWDPLTQDEPVGFKKRVASRRRQAPGA